MATTKELVYSFMLEYQDENGEPPMMKEIVKHFGQLSHKSSVRHNMVLLVEEGLVEELGATGSPRRYEAVTVE